MSDDRRDVASATVEALAERLLDAAANGRFEAELARANQTLDARPAIWPEEDIVRARVLFFDLALVSTSDRRLRASTAIDLLSALGDAGWAAVLQTNRIDEIRQLTDEPDLGLELIELLLYAPDADVRDFAIARLEGIGIERAMGNEDTRAVERLLHAAGARDAAYRLEAARKARHRRDLPVRSSAVPDETGLPYRVIAIAGGHAQLRGSAAALLEPAGISIVQIPSSREAVRRERDILEALQGCDLAMLLVRQVTHSTSDQVRKAAERLGVPVMFSNAASAVAIERQLRERAAAGTKE